MKVVIQDNNSFVLRFDKGAEVIDGLNRFFSEQGITAAVFSGIGACQGVELEFYRQESKDYHKQSFNEDLEIISLNGNIAFKDSQCVVHCHGVFGKNDFSTVGGHVSKLIVSVTCEIFLTKLEGKLERKSNPDFNLNLLT